MASNKYTFDIKYPHYYDKIEEVLEHTLVPFVDKNNIITHYYNPSNNTILSAAKKDVTNQVFLGPSEFDNDKEIIIDPASITINNLKHTLEKNIDPLFNTVDLELDPNMNINIPTQEIPTEPIKYNENYNSKILLSVFGLIFLVSLILLIYKACDNGLLKNAKKDMNKGISKIVKRFRK